VSLKKWEGSDTLHFNVALKNVSDSIPALPGEYFPGQRQGSGGLIPRKTKGGLVEPGQTASFVYPVSGMDCGPKSIVLMVKTMNQ
jgi:hypothetical protein